MKKTILLALIMCLGIATIVNANIYNHKAGFDATSVIAFSSQVYGDGNYIYLGGTDNLIVLEFNGINFTQIDTIISPSVSDITGDGTYIYTANYFNGLYAYYFNGTDIVQVGYYDTTGTPYGLWFDGTYIYEVDGRGSGINAFTFNGTEFTLIANTEAEYPSASYQTALWGDGTYLYESQDLGGIRVFTFNGTNFTQTGATSSGGYTQKVWGDGTYIYEANYDNGVNAYSFNGTDFTFITNINNGGRNSFIKGDGNYIYVSGENDQIEAYTFNGINFTTIEVYPEAGYNLGIFVDEDYVYVANTLYGLNVYQIIPPSQPPIIYREANDLTGAVIDNGTKIIVGFGSIALLFGLFVGGAVVVFAFNKLIMKK